jgi:hypothetical protein
MAKATMFTNTAMRKRFHELREAVEAVEKKSGPLRKKRDDLLAKYEPEVKKLEREYLGIEEGLADMKIEMGAISRFLKGATSEPEERKATETAE